MTDPYPFSSRIGEKFPLWSDVTPSDETIIEFVTLYWITNTIERCIYPYRQVCPPLSFLPLTTFLKPNAHPFTPSFLIPIQDLPDGAGTLTLSLPETNTTPHLSKSSLGTSNPQPPIPFIEKPMGFSSFPKELAVTPKSWVASQGNLVWYRAHDKVCQLSFRSNNPV